MFYSQSACEYNCEYINQNLITKQLMPNYMPYMQEY